MRYIKDIPVDKAFYEAGLYAMEGGMKGVGFDCWNRFLDVCEVFEDEGEEYILFYFLRFLGVHLDC